MNVYETEQIRNVVLPGHGGAGKITVTEALVLLTGVTKRTGRVPDGNTIGNHDKEEIKRQLSISITLIPLEYKREDGLTKINLLDAPGFFDFVEEVGEAIGVTDAAIIAANYKAGIEPGTERAQEMYEKYNLFRLIFIASMGDDHASHRELVVKLGTKFGRKIAPSQLPVRENEKFVGFVNVVKMGEHRFTNLSNHEEREIPDYIQKNLAVTRDTPIKAVAKTGEEYVERYFFGEGFTQKEISTALRTHVIEGDIVPVMVGSDINYQGFKVLLQAIGKYFLLPDHFECIGVDVFTGERFAAKYNDDVSLSARVFRTTVDPFIGEYLLMKTCIGTLEGDAIMYNVGKDTEEKIGELYILRGKDQVEMQGLRAGDTGTVTKLTVTQIGDTMAVHTAPIVYYKPQISTPYTYMTYKAASKGKNDKIFTALAKVTKENLTLKVTNDAESHQVLLCGIGDQRLDAVTSKPQSRYKVGVILSPSKLAFRGTLYKKVKIQDKHKKQSGRHGQYGGVIMGFEPSGDLEIPHVFEERILDSSVPGNYFPAVKKGLQECILKGPLAGYPVVGLKATPLDGSYHPMDPSEMASKMAIIPALKQGLMETNPVLPEPIASLKVTVSDKSTGDVMGDLNRRGGRVLGMNSNHNGKQIIEADILMSELSEYNTDLRFIAGGLGNHSYEFSHYEQAPGDVQKREIETRTAARDGEQK